MAVKASVCKNKNEQPKELENLLDQVVLHFEELNFVCRANVPNMVIDEKKKTVGYTIDFDKKAVICDIISGLIKDIKKIKAS